MLDSDRYIIDIDQLDCSVGGADTISSSSATPTIAHLVSSTKDHVIPIRNHVMSTKDHVTPIRDQVIPMRDHVTPISDHVTTPRSGGDILKLLRMKSSNDYTSSAVAKNSTTSE